MALTLLGTKQDGICSWKGTKWWAEGGLIHFEDPSGKFGSIPVRDILLRLNALKDMLGNSLRHPDGIVAHRDEMLRHQDYVEGMIKLCKKAQDQGRPDDPKAIAQMRRDRKSAVSRLHVMPGLNARF